MICMYQVAAWNANKLTQHLKATEMFLNINTVDILLVSENHFTNITSSITWIRHQRHR